MRISHWRGGWQPWIRLSRAVHSAAYGGGRTWSLRFGALSHRWGAYWATGR